MKTKTSVNGIKIWNAPEFVKAQGHLINAYGIS